MVVVGDALAPPRIAVVGRARATTIAGGYVGGEGEGDRERGVEFEGIGIREGKTEELGVRGREKRRRSELEGKGGAACDTNHAHTAAARSLNAPRL